MDLASVPSIILPRDFVDSAFPVTAAFGQVNKAYWPNDHQGLDRGSVKDAAGQILRPIEGAQIMTPWAGIVQLSGPDPKGYFGNRTWVIFKDERYGECRCLFAHMKEFFLVEGSRVEQSVVAGLVGGTGTRRDGSPVPVHIHFQVERWPSRELLRPVLPKSGGLR